MGPLREYDIVIVGAGVLGASIAYELSVLYGGRVAVLDKEHKAGIHTSTRNTGVIHRPFYLDPARKEVFARSAQVSYGMWKELALKHGMPWSQKGTLEIATRESDVDTLESYGKWASSNGMSEDEFRIFGDDELKSYEPMVRGYGAFLSITDTCTSFGALTEKILELAAANGVTFFADSIVDSVEETGKDIDITCTKGTERVSIRAKFLINCSGGGALPLAHSMHLAKQYAVLHFRGDYWMIGESYPGKLRNNIYTVPKHRKFPFLDPHFILREDGRRELGPNAALVATPYDYSDNPDSGSLAMKLLERPALPKLKLLTNTEFISLVRSEWKSSRSREEMARRVREFIPDLKTSYITGRGLSGVRNSLISTEGFVPEAKLVQSEHSIHVLNYNSPGATGAPAFALHVIGLLAESGKIRLKDGSDPKAQVWQAEISARTI